MARGSRHIFWRETRPCLRKASAITAFFSLNSGLIRTFYASPSGREITLAYWKPGNIVGTPTVLGTGHSYVVGSRGRGHPRTMRSAATICAS